jgi:hypothetical protein
MIVYDLCCDAGHRFEGWFGSSADYAAQRERGLLACPQCGSGAVDKAPMAPAVPMKGNRQPEAKRSVAGGALPPEAAAMMQKLAELQTEALKTSTWVGDAFAEQSRAIHYGEREAASIHGQATPDEAQALHDEGITVMPLLFPVAAPDELN